MAQNRKIDDVDLCERGLEMKPTNVENFIMGNIWNPQWSNLVLSIYIYLDLRLQGDSQARLIFFFFTFFFTVLRLSHGYFLQSKYHSVGNLKSQLI